MLTPLIKRASSALAITLLAATLPACDSGTPAPSDSSPESLVADAMAADQPTEDPTVLEPASTSAIDIGDVEQALTVVGRLSERSRLESITETLLPDRRKRIRQVTIEVKPPNPSSLWLAIRVDSSREFIEQPVVLDTKVYADDELIDSFIMVLAAGANDNLFQKDVDVLFGRDEIPDTMLITMKSEALLLPEGLDLTTTDPYSVTEGTRTKAISHTPVRIDFAQPGPKPEAPKVSSEPAPAPAPQ